LKVFADTNVLVAAFATRGLCADVLRTILAEHELLLSARVLEELVRVLVGKIGVPEETAQEIGGFLRSCASVVAEAPALQPILGLRDPDDEAILGAALAMGADVLVTGDKDLLEAPDAPRLRIVDPRGFWLLVRKRS
jgi:putative PIN family toxin of toxin-antitoxin system